MKRKRPKLPNEDSTRPTFHYNTRSRTRKGFSKTDPVNESASLRVTKRRKKKKEVSDERSTNLDLQLPIDLIMEILNRLPVKTLARFLCVSKIWASIIRSRDLRKLFLAESSNRPGRLFFTFKREDNDCVDCLLFSWNQTESAYHLSYLEEDRINSASCVHDLICFGNASRSGFVLYNSTTRTSITLPSLESGTFVLRHFLCYDPIDAVYKVLCICVIRPKLVLKVLTLGNGNEWRRVENCRAYFPRNHHICTNGILYYDAFASSSCRKVVVISFDVRSETFHLIKVPFAPRFSVDCLSTMTRYEEKLAIILHKVSANASLALWVLEDATKHQWLKKVFVLPNSWTSLAVDIPIPLPSLHALHYFLNITVEGEFIVAPLFTLLPPFYLLYYNPKRNSVRKVSIEGIVENELLQWNSENPCLLSNIFSSQVESLMFW